MPVAVVVVGEEAVAQLLRPEAVVGEEAVVRLQQPALVEELRLLRQRLLQLRPLQLRPLRLRPLRLQFRRCLQLRMEIIPIRTRQAQRLPEVEVAVRVAPQPVDSAGVPAEVLPQRQQVERLPVAGALQHLRQDQR